MRQVRKAIYTIILTATLLAACGTAPAIPVPTVTSAPRPTPVRLTSTVPPVTLTPTSLSPASIPSFPPVALSAVPEGLRVAYIDQDGNIQIQSGDNEPMQLTNSRDISYPLFSEDGERLIFRSNAAISSIHSDGTQERPLITKSMLASLGLGYNESTYINFPVFIAGTHQVLFNTQQFTGNKKPGDIVLAEEIKPNLDLLFADLDTGKIKSLLSPGKCENFVPSPDGSMIAVQASGHIDVIGINGEMIHQNLATYTPSQPYELIPGMFWTQDSAELIVTLPVDSVYPMPSRACRTDVGPRSVWRYSVDSGVGVHISLAPPPIGGSHNQQVSPDGNWMLYFYAHVPDCKTDETVTQGLYLANLREGTAQFYTTKGYPTWNTDSKHFVLWVHDQGIFLGSIDMPPLVKIDRAVDWLIWIDSTHYLGYSYADGIATGVVVDINGETTYFPASVPIDALLEVDNRQFAQIYVNP